MRKRWSNSLPKQGLALLSLVVLCILSLFGTADAAVACPSELDEFGSELLEQANNDPIFYKLYTHEPSNFDARLSAIFYCTVQGGQYLGGFRMIYGSAGNQEFGDLVNV